MTRKYKVIRRSESKGHSLIDEIAADQVAVSNQGMLTLGIKASAGKAYVTYYTVAVYAPGEWKRVYLLEEE